MKASTTVEKLSIENHGSRSMMILVGTESTRISWRLMKRGLQAAQKISEPSNRLKSQVT